jgi:alpha-mannosidase
LLRPAERRPGILRAGPTASAIHAWTSILCTALTVFLAAAGLTGPRVLGEQAVPTPVEAAEPGPDLQDVLRQKLEALKAAKRDSVSGIVSLLLGIASSDLARNTDPQLVPYHEALLKALRELDLSALDSDDQEGVAQALQHLAATLKPIQEKLGGQRLHLVGFEPVPPDTEDPAEVTAELLSRNLRLARDFPGYVFVQPEASRLAAVEARHPELWPQLQEGVRSGSLALAGGAWARFDSGLTTGESQIRQMLLGQSYLRQRFGAPARTGWCSNALNLGSNLPQILAGAGIRDLWVSQPAGPTSLFWWQGLDGTRVLAQRSAQWGEARAEDKPSAIPAVMAADAAGARDVVIAVGSRDLRPGAQRAELEAIEQVMKLSVWPGAAYEPPDKAFEAIRTAGGLPVTAGEIGAVLEAPLLDSTQVKAACRRAEDALTQAETYCTMATRFGASYPTFELQGAWKLLLSNQSPELLGGLVGRRASRLALKALAEVSATARSLQAEALKRIASLVDTQIEGTPLLVLNSLGISRTDVVQVPVPVPLGGGYPRVFDDSGLECPAQMAWFEEPTSGGDPKLLFLASNVPALGYRLFHLVWTKEPSKITNSLAVEDGTDPQELRRHPIPEEVTLPSLRLSNEFVSLTIDRESGGVVSLTDKRNNSAELVAEGSALGRLVSVLEHGGPNSSISLDASPKRQVSTHGAVVRVLERGPVRAVVRIDARQEDEDQPLRGVRRYLILSAGSPRIECPLEVSWDARGDESGGVPGLRVQLGFAAASQRVTSEVPLGAVSRQAKGAFFPLQRWLDVSGPSSGMSVLVDGPGGAAVSHDSGVTTVELGLLRSAYVVDPAQDLGDHLLRYALLPHGGVWQKSGTPWQALKWSHPLACVVATGHAGIRQSNWSLAWLESPNALVTAVKRAEGNPDLIFRVAEPSGAPAVASLMVPGAMRAQETNLLEDPVGASPSPRSDPPMPPPPPQGGASAVGNPQRGPVRALGVSLTPWQVKTVRVRLPRLWTFPLLGSFTVTTPPPQVIAAPRQSRSGTGRRAPQASGATALIAPAPSTPTLPQAPPSAE